MAQQFHAIEGYSVDKKELHTGNIDENTKPVVNNNAGNRAPGDTVWIDGFDNAGDWSFIPPAGQTGLDPNSNGWSIGSANNSWANFQTMSTSLPYARFVNLDPTANPTTHVEDGPFIFEYANTIDLTGVPAPHLEFEQYGARFVTTQEIQISTDGGATWQTASANSDIAPLTAAGGSAYPNTQTRRFNITSIVSGNPANVQIRLFWDGAMNGQNMNYVEYAWFLDNIRIVEGEQHDLKLASFEHGTTTEGYVYSKFPLDQISPNSFGGRVENNGGDDQTNTQLNVDVIGNAYLESSVMGFTLNSGDTDSLEVTNAFTPPSTIGTYDIKGYVTSDNALTNNDDDTLTKSIEVTEFIYGTDYGPVTGSFTDWSNNNGQASLGNVYEIVNDDQFWGVDVGIAGPSVNTGNESNLLFVEVQKYNDNTQEFEFLAVSQDYNLVTGDMGNVITILFDNPVQVTAGDLLLVVATHYGGAGVVGIQMAGQGIQGTVLGYNDQSQLISLIDPDYPVVRINFDESLGNEDLSIQSKDLNISPNPFNNTASIEYGINATQDVSLKITDLTGKVVYEKEMGTQNAGTHTIDLDATNFAEGTYLYSIITNGQATTKRMVVTK